MNCEKKVVVLVDDSLVHLRVGISVLEKKYTVITMPSAKGLFSVLDTVVPALILLDIDMPEMNGFQAMEILKAKPETKDIPIIFLTSRAAEKDRSKGLALGAADYITKPYEAAYLLMKIKIALGEDIL